MKTKDERWPFHVAKSLVERIDAWRARNPSFRSRGDAARELLKRALDGEEGKDQELLARKDC